MNIFWMLTKSGEPTEAGFGSRGNFIAWIERRNLTQRAPAEWIVDLLSVRAANGTSRYTNVGVDGKRWSLTWGEAEQGADDIANPIEGPY